MVHRLGYRQSTQWGKDSKRIGRQHHDGFGVTGHAPDSGIRQDIEAIGCTPVFGQTGIIVVRDMRIGVDDDILEDSAELSSSGIDFGLAGRRQANRFGVAATFEIKDATIAPTVFVIAHHGSLRVCRKCRFAGTRQAKEHRRIAIAADIYPCVHGHDITHGQQVVEQRKDGFFDFAGVGCPTDNDGHTGSIEHNGDIRSSTVACGECVVRRCMEDGDERLLRGI